MRVRVLIGNRDLKENPMLKEYQNMVLEIQNKVCINANHQRHYYYQLKHAASEHGIQYGFLREWLKAVCDIID